jgi:hypothetical protein
VFGEQGLTMWRDFPGWRVLKDILPNSESALEGYKSIIEAGRQYANRIVNIGGEGEEIAKAQKGFGDRITKSEEARFRYARSWQVPQNLKNLGPRWGRSIPFALAMAPAHIRSELEEEFNKFSVFKIKDADDLYSLFKQITELYKKQGELLSPNWKWFINWEVLGGYLDKKEINEFANDIEGWVTGDVKHSMFDGKVMDENLFLDTFREGMVDFMSQSAAPAGSVEVVSIEDFASDRSYWGTSGTSSIGNKITYRVNGSTYRSRKSKWATALTLDSKKIVDMLTTDSRVLLRSTPKPIQKQETGKVRAIVTSEDSLYIRTSYVLMHIERMMKGSECSTLFMNSSQLVEMWETLSVRLTGENVRIPLDQSHFDWQQNKEMINIFFNVVADFIKVNFENNSELLQVWESVRLSTVEIPYTIEVGNEVFEVMKGILSGWRKTAFIDTAMNWAEMFCAVRQLTILDFAGSINSLIAQGDDDQVETDSYGYAAGLTLAYKIMNFEVNPGKFFVSSSRDEYLRQVIEKGVVSGYPVRGVTSIMWRGPETIDPPKGVLRLQEQLVAWNTIAGRGADFNFVRKHMRIDMSQGNGLTLLEVDKLLHTPVSFGGLGYFPDNSIGYLRFTKGESNTVPEVLSELTGLRDELQRWDSYDVVFNHAEVVNEISKMVNFPKAKRKIIVEPGVEEANVFKPYRGKLSSGPGPPLQCPRAQEVRGVLSDLALRKKIKEKDWNWIRMVWIDPNYREMSARVESHGGRRLWLSWMTGDLPKAVPNIPLYSSLVVSSKYNELYRGTLSRIFNSQRFNMNTVRELAYRIELEVREVVQEMEVRIGG